MQKRKIVKPARENSCAISLVFVEIFPVNDRAQSGGWVPDFNSLVQFVKLHCLYLAFLKILNECAVLYLCLQEVIPETRNVILEQERLLHLKDAGAE